MVVQPGPVIEFLLANLNVKDPYSVDWKKVQRLLPVLFNFTDFFASFEKYLIFFFSCHQAGRALKNLRVKV